MTQSQQVTNVMARYQVTTKAALLRAVRDELNEECWEPGDGPKFTVKDAELRLDGMYEAEYQRIASVPAEYDEPVELTYERMQDPDHGDYRADAEELEQAASFGTTPDDTETETPVTLKWTKVDLGLRSLNWTTPLPAPFDCGESEPATHINRWYNRDERSWVVSYSDEKGTQIGSSEYVYSVDDAVANAIYLFNQAATISAERAAAATDMALHGRDQNGEGYGWDTPDSSAVADAIDNAVYARNAAAEPWNDAAGAELVAEADAILAHVQSMKETPTAYASPDDVPDAIWFSDATITPNDDGTLAVNSTREDPMNATANPFDSLPDNPVDVATDEGQAALAAAAKAADEARRAAKKDTEKAKAQAAADRKAAADAARQPGPVEIVQPPVNGKPTKAARAAGVEIVPATPAAEKALAKTSARKAAAEARTVTVERAKAAKPKASKPASGRTPGELTLGAPITIDGVTYRTIVNRDGTLAAHQTANYAWKCPTCGLRIRRPFCDGTAAAPHPASNAPVNYMRADRIVK